MASIYRYRRKRVRQARRQNGQVAQSRVRALLTIFLVGVAASVFVVLAAGIFLYRSYASDLKPPEEAIAENTIGTSLAYDRTGGHLLYEYVDPHGGLKDPKPLAEISPYLIAATVATEDASFFENPGVNFRGLARAGIENLTPFGPGFLAGSGGSSITQQLAKNIYIDADERFDRRIQRKLKETVIALELKRKYDDYQILEWYLNHIYYGNFAFGAEAAAQRHFAKPAADLTLAEAALLAGLPQAPGNYTPAIAENRDRAKARQLEVLELMIKHREQVNEIKDPANGLPLLQLSAEQIEAAKEAPIEYQLAHVDMDAPHFVLLVEDQVSKMCSAGLFNAPGGIPCDKVVTQGGLRITTSIDMGLQRIGERVVEEELARSEHQFRGHNGSLVAIKPETGEVLTYVGSRDYNREDIDGQVDIATSVRSHGSTMKVFTYLTAFEQGWVPSTFIRDEPLFLGEGAQRKQINNWNFRHMGNITIRKALAESVNTTAVRTLMEVGEDDMRDAAHRLGITDLLRTDCGPTITLGACEVKLLDMTFAYATIANSGIMKGRPSSEELPSALRDLDPVTVLKIRDNFGNVIYEFDGPAEQEVVDPAAAYMVTDILSRDAISWSRLNLDWPAAAKTGTSEDFRDGVVMGFTRDLAAGVWMGNADNTPMAPGTFSSAGSGPMWRRFMQEAHQYLLVPAREFEPPESAVLSPCGGRQEVFKLDQSPSRPGACRAPAGSGSGPRPSPGGSSPTPRPTAPAFPPRATPTPEATLTPTPSPTPEPTPQPTDDPRPGPGGFFYVVEEGDTIQSIADKFGMHPDDIRDANGFPPGTEVVAGDVIFIPASSEPSGQGNQGRGNAHGHG